MQSLQKPILFLFFLACSSLVFAQKSKVFHTIQVGTFVGASIEDFSSLENYGYVYAEPIDDNQYRVFLGGYLNIVKAKNILSKVQQSGFQDAFLTARTLDKGTQVSVVQLASKGINEPIHWPRFLNMGRIHLILDDELIKIVSGVYPNAEAATKRLERAREMNFEDAFVKTINSILLHEVNPFETNGLSTNGNIVTEVAITPQEELIARGTVSARNIPTSFDYASSKTIVIPPKAITEGKSLSKSADFEKTALPITIQSGVQLQSVKWLQELLQKEGNYKGAIDGYYGEQTKAAFKATLQSNEQLHKYSKYNSSAKRFGDFRDWDDTKLLQTITNAINPIDVNCVDNSIIQKQYLSPEALDTNTKHAIVSWDYRFRRGLKMWALEDTSHELLARALKISYLQTQIRLEQYYQSKGYNVKIAHAQALYSLNLLVGKQLERFQ